MKTPAERITQRRADMPKAYRGIYDAAMTGKRRRAAMHAFCLECMGWAREEVRACTSNACPLFPYRPYTDAQDAPFCLSEFLQTDSLPTLHRRARCP